MKTIEIINILGKSLNSEEVKSFLEKYNYKFLKKDVISAKSCDTYFWIENKNNINLLFDIESKNKKYPSIKAEKKGLFYPILQEIRIYNDKIISDFPFDINFSTSFEDLIKKFGEPKKHDFLEFFYWNIELDSEKDLRIYLELDSDNFIKEISLGIKNDIDFIFIYDGLNKSFEDFFSEASFLLEKNKFFIKNFSKIEQKMEKLDNKFFNSLDFISKELENKNFSLSDDNLYNGQKLENIGNEKIKKFLEKIIELKNLEEVFKNILEINENFYKEIENFEKKAKDYVKNFKNYKKYFDNFLEELENFDDKKDILEFFYVLKKHYIDIRKNYLKFFHMKNALDTFSFIEKNLNIVKWAIEKDLFIKNEENKDILEGIKKGENTVFDFIKLLRRGYIAGSDFVVSEKILRKYLKRIDINTKDFSEEDLKYDKIFKDYFG